MQKCPFNNTCTKLHCDMSCSEFATYEHWMNRCNLSVANPVFKPSLDDLATANKIIDQSHRDEDNFNSNYNHISVYAAAKDKFIADLVSYELISRQCRNTGFYAGVYKLNFSQYLDDIRATWSSRNIPEHLENTKIWIESAKYLVIYNLGLVRFGDFESQTLLTLFQERYGTDKYTILILENGKYSLPGKNDSLFYQKLKKEITSRGVRV